ncbi:Pectinesterase-like protein 3 [Elsinoe fawcettii]|nr:Pectinesterase-like protein 3 [Elsinoe fawcettii]
MQAKRLLWAALCAASAIAQSCDDGSSSCSTTSSASATQSTPTTSSGPTTTSVVPTTTSAQAATAITVTAGGSINSAIAAAQNSAIASVVIQAGTYTEAITIQGTQTVTIAGPTGTGFAANQVVIQSSVLNTGVVTFNTQKSKGVTFKNVNITNTAGAGNVRAPAVSMSGLNMAFYDCALVSVGAGVYTASYGTTIIANSYIEGSDKLFYNYPTAYVYGSTIVPTMSSANIFYGLGASIGGTWYNSTMVCDSSTVTTKPGLSNTYVYLAQPNGNYTQAVYRGTSLGTLIAPAALRSGTNGACNYINFYGEFQNTGPGALSASNAASRAAVCDIALTSSQVSSLTIDQVFGKAFSGFSSFDTTWIDSKVLSAIQASNSAQLAAAGPAASTTSATSSIGSSSSVTSSSIVASSLGQPSLSTTGSSSLPPSSSLTTPSSTVASATPSSTDGQSSSATTSSTSGQATTTTTTSVASSSASSAAAITVATDGTAQYTDINAAVLFAQNNAVPTVSVKAGTYGPISVTGTATVTVIGPTASSVADNQVVVAGNGATAALSIGTLNTKGSTFRFINFTNPGTSGVASAVSARGINLGLYTCALISAGQGVYSASYGITIIADSYIEGPDKLFYNYPTVYLYRSTIAPTASGSSIFYAKGQTFTVNGVSQWYNSSLVVDSSTVAQKSGGTASNVWLATPNGQTGYTTAIYRNTSIGSLVAAGGVYSTTCSVAAISGEFQTTGTGAYAANSAARKANCDQLLSADQVSLYTLDKIFAQAFYGYANSDTTWVDSSVLSAITAGAAAQVASAGSTASTTTSATSSASTDSGSSTSSGATTTTSSASTSCATLAPGATLVVSLNATSCEYQNVTAAIAVLPNDSKAYTISIKAGVYNEQISITRNGKVTLVGETTFVNDYTQNKVTIQFSRGVLTSAGQNELTPVIYSKKTNDNSGLALYNINFVNTYPQTTNTAALAADFYGANMAAYGCSFVGFQDTLLANKGTQVFSNSYIEGSVDFIWGFSTAYFRQCYIASNTKGACIAAQSRPAGTVSGYVFDSCYVSYTTTYGSAMGTTYLGRPYNNLSTVVYMNSYLDSHINSAGWNIWSTSSPQTDGVTFGEYNNTGPGSWQQGTARASFATNFSASQVAPYTLANWISDTSFIDQTAWNYKPSFSWNATTTTGSGSGTTTGVPKSTTTATVNAHPDSGTVPPQFAVLVSADGSVNGSFTNVTAALASLPNDNTNQTVFIYPGTYVEQVPSINRPGAVRIIGYTSGSPGKNYQDNKVTISFARGLSVSPLPVGHSNAETAVIQTASSRISFYNINMVNTDNLDGLEANYVTLAASIYGNDIGFYACSFNGWQDTLLNGATNGYQYYESCYIGGAIDFIWGYSKAYFKGCTIGAKRAKSCVAAHSRSSLSAIGGYIFDQCLFTAAPDNTADLAGAVYLGRPYSQYSLVVVKNSYLDSVIQPSGWKIWSATDPRTDHITFAEYNNVGPGNWENNVAARQAFQNATLLTSDTYGLASVMDSTSWIDMTYWDSIVTPQPAVKNTTVPTNTTVSGNSTYDGTKPPTGALIVSKSPIAGQTVYNTIQGAIDAAPTSSKTNATIFIYPGVYEEKIIVNKSGSTIFIGYSSDTDDFSKNQVTIQQSFGVDTQGTGSNVDAATVYATGNYFYAYNVNFRNNNGTQQNIASLGFAVKSSKYAFLHGCQVYGNQDTLYINGYFFAFKSYVEGNVDFIFGTGSGYFLNSTISPNEDGVAITADKRTTNTTQAGLVFDQSSIIPAAGMTGFKNVSLGRPWNNNARVLYVSSYLDGMIGSAGWTQWSKSSPQTAGVIFAEYHNFGPGSGICNRAAFSTQLSDTDVVAYQLSNFFPTTSWIDFSVVDVQPFVAGSGSAPTACGISTTSTSMLSTTSTSLISSSSVSLITVFKTRTVTEKQTASATITNPDVTVTATSVITENHGTTVTPAPVLRTSTVKSTEIVTVTSVQAAKTATVKATETITSVTTIAGKSTTVEVDTTVVQTRTVAGKDSTVQTTSTFTNTVTSTPKAVTSTSTDLITQTTTIHGKDSTIQTTVTNVRTINAAASTVTVKTTLTSSFTVTSAPGPVTISSNAGGTVTSVRTATQKGVTTTSVLTIAGSTATKTTSAKASTITASVTSLKTTTKGTTVTAPCTPAAKLFRRGLAARAAGTVTSTLNVTITTVVATSTYTQKGSTFSTVITSTSSIYPTTTLKAATSTVVSTQVATSTSTFVQTAASATITSLKQVTAFSTVSLPGTTSTITGTTTSLVTETLPGSTVTNTASKTTSVTITAPASTILRTATSTSLITESVAGSTVFSTRTVSATITISAAAVTTTSSKVVSVTSTFTAARETTTIAYSSDVTVFSTTTLPVATSTVTKTTSLKASTVLITITPAPATKTTTLKQTTTIFTTVTKAAKNC